MFIKYFTVANRGRFSIPYFGINISKKIVKDADVIVFHWINEGFISLNVLKKLAKLNKPIVWLLHDMWAFTGGCHYSGGCKKYISVCNTCPSLKFHGTKKDTSTAIQNLKKDIFPMLNLNIITCSNWLAKTAMSSSLFNGMNIKTIPNSIDINIFRPTNKIEAKIKLNLPIDKKHILFVAFTANETRKGFHLLKEALKILNDSGNEIVKNIELLVLGRADEDLLREISLPIRSIGRLSEEIDLAEVYNAADVFTAPSLEDNLPNTVMESLACGTIPIAFNIGGMPDMIEHKINGYLAKPFLADDLTNGIIWALSLDLVNCENIKNNARSKVVNNFTPEIVGKKHLDYYKSIL